MPQVLTQNRCAICDLPLDAEYFDVSGFVGNVLIEDNANDLLVQMFKKEISEMMVYALRVDNNHDNIIAALRQDIREVIVKIPGGDAIKKMIVDSLKTDVSTPILTTLEAITKKLEETRGKTRTETRGKPGRQTEKAVSNPGMLSAPELTPEPAPALPTLTAPLSLTEEVALKQQDALAATTPTGLIQMSPRSPVQAQPVKPVEASLFSDLKIGEGLPRRGEQKVLASFQLHPQYCGVLTYFAQYTDLYARDNSQIRTPGFEWVILQNGKPLFPYMRLELIVNPWGNNCLPVAVRLDENARLEFVLRNRSITDEALTSDDPAISYPIRAFAGRLMGRYWYNEIFGERTRPWRDS
ncbi:MAG: hypothetical protein ACREOI_07755 [bacterium]